jgi:hypothetical protein
MKVYEYIPMPIPDEDNKDASKKIRDIYFCENLNVVRLADENAAKDHELCLLSLKKQRYEEVRKFCPITVAPLRDRVQQINALEFIIQQKESTQGDVICQEKNSHRPLEKRRQRSSASSSSMRRPNKRWEDGRSE